MKKFLKKLMTKTENDDALKVSHPPMIIAVDFDGTCVRERFPLVGEDMPGAVPTLHGLVNRGHSLILWTCREGKELQDAVNWFKDKEIPLFGINETPLDADFRPEGGRKVYANLYIDDRSFGGFPGWYKIHQELLGIPLIY